MFILDSDSYESSLESLCNGFSCTPEQLHNVLQSIDIDKIYNDENPDMPSEEYLYEHVISKLGNHKKLNLVYWFHTTRTLPSNNYENGILTLSLVLSHIWNILIENAPNKTIKKDLEFKKINGISNYQYNLKTTDTFSDGPYGILIKEVSLHAKRLSQHDYLAIPEIIEDILDYNETLLAHYRKILVPKIVKFKSTKYLDNACIKTTLFYLYRKVRNHKIDMNSILCFDGEGEVIVYEDIINVEIVNLN